MENFSVVVKRVTDNLFNWEVRTYDPPEDYSGTVTFPSDERAASKFEWNEDAPDNWEDIEEKILDSISSYNRDQTIIEINSSTKEKTHDTESCEKCNGRTALITGIFCYSPTDEPYEIDKKEESEVTDGECWVGGYKCDDCGHIQGLWHE